MKINNGSAYKASLIWELIPKTAAFSKSDGKVGEKQWQKIPDPIFGLCLSCLTPSASSGSFITGSFYQFIKANPQVRQINKRWIEKWECLYSSTRMQVFPHLQVHESFIFQGGL